jgi:hypothetical protein
VKEPVLVSADARDVLCRTFYRSENQIEVESEETLFSLFWRVGREGEGVWGLTGDWRFQMSKVNLFGPLWGFMEFISPTGWYNNPY